MSVKVKGLEELKKETTDYRKTMVDRKKKCLRKLADIGELSAALDFSTAMYDGTNDVIVSSKWNGSNQIVVSAKGEAVTFIEFGTGLVYMNDENGSEAEAIRQELGMIRGEYGKGRGSEDSWVYLGEAGSNGYQLSNGAILTHGNIANRCMYEAYKAIEKNLVKTVEEAFRFD